MKRYLSAFLIVCLLFGLVACGGNAAPVKPTTDAAVGSTTDPGGDGSTTEPGNTEPTDPADPEDPTDPADPEDPTDTTTSSKAGTSGSTTTKAGKTTTTTKKTTKTTKSGGTKPLTPVSVSDYYFRSVLAKESDKLVKTYDRISKAVDRLADEESFKDLNITKAEFLRVIEYYQNDNPQHFWFLGNVPYYSKDGIIDHAEFNYEMKKADIPAAKKKVEAAVTEMLKGLGSDTSEYEREITIYRRLTARCEYDEKTVMSSTLYGALIEKIAICDGYSRAFQYLCYCAGIPCIRIYGVSRKQDHAWNMVKIGGKWYHADPTWDDPYMKDPRGFSGFSYFNRTTAEISKNHAIINSVTNNSVEIKFNWPSATSTAACYFTKTGITMKSYNHNDFLKACKAAAAEGLNWVAITMTGDVAKFNEAFVNDYEKLKKDMKSAGYPDYFKSNDPRYTPRDDLSVVYYYIK